MQDSNKTTTTVVTADALLKHWQGHRGLTRRVIEAFPEKELFEYAIGGMRPFAVQVIEVAGLTGPGIEGLATGNWGEGLPLHITGKGIPQTKERLLGYWDIVTRQMETYWPQIGDFYSKVKAFGQYEGTIISTILYFIDNEVHHRSQGYVYLRALGIEPPAFWDR